MCTRYLKHCFLLLFLIGSYTLSAQSRKVESSHSIKGPIIGLSYSYEHPIALQSTLNFELIFNGGFGSGIFRDDYWIIAPVIRVEPRYYYNFIKRYKKAKKTINNSANYLAIAFDFQPGISIGKNAQATQYLQIVPKYGLKRTIGSHFIFEIATGVGAYVLENEGWSGVFALDFKFGYAF